MLADLPHVVADELLALFSSVFPAMLVMAAASTLLESTIDERTRHELTETILQEAQRLNRLVRNLLDMTRLEAGAERHLRRRHRAAPR